METEVGKANPIKLLIEFADKRFNRNGLIVKQQAKDEESCGITLVGEIPRFINEYTQRLFFHPL